MPRFRKCLFLHSTLSLKGQRYMNIFACFKTNMCIRLSHMVQQSSKAVRGVGDVNQGSPDGRTSDSGAICEPSRPDRRVWCPRRAALVWEAHSAALYSHENTCRQADPTWLEIWSELASGCHPDRWVRCPQRAGMLTTDWAAQENTSCRSTGTDSNLTRNWNQQWLMMSHLQSLTI